MTHTKMSMALQLFQLPLASSSSSSSASNDTLNLIFSQRHQRLHFCVQNHKFSIPSCSIRTRKDGRARGVVYVGKEETSIIPDEEQQEREREEDDEDEGLPPTPEDLEYVNQIKRVLELLRKNRDMYFNEVKLTIMIEDPREVERRRLLGIEDPDAPTRDDLGDALVEVNEGKVPKNRLALRLLAEEMNNWPNLEVEAPKTKKPGKSLYAKATDTGIDPKEAAKRLKVDWDTAAEIDDGDDNNDAEVPSVLGYGALYLVTAFPIIIGISVVLILFYNSLQ